MKACEEQNRKQKDEAKEKERAETSRKRTWRLFCTVGIDVLASLGLSGALGDRQAREKARGRARVNNYDTLRRTDKWECMRVELGPDRRAAHL